MIYRELKLIFEGKNSLIYYQKDSEYGCPIVIKTLKGEYPSPKQIAQFNNEYEFTKGFAIQGVRKAFKRDKIDGKEALFLEYIEGTTLKNHFRENKGVKEIHNLLEFLQVAIQVTNILAAIHAKNIIHKDINSNNILVDTQTGEVSIIDFGISSETDSSIPAINNAEILEGTLSYISPEQTGRTNRTVDYRSDLYSLGITFYEILAGEVPFQVLDSMQLVYSHIAKKPRSLHNSNPRIPKQLSNIVMKLIEKNAEKRYQSALGLKHDLTELKKAIKSKFSVTEVVGEEETMLLEDIHFPDFKIATQDFSGRLKISGRLYGREKEAQHLKDAFGKVKKGGCELVIVTGNTGTGKSLFVQEVSKELTESQGYFLFSKSEEIQKAAPYSVITQAFNQFCNYLLMENKEDLEKWKEDILENTDGQIHWITDLIPNLNLIVGKQRKLQETEQEEDLDDLLIKFISTICSKRSPLILFVDDIQWTDNNSIRLLNKILEHESIQYFLLVLTYQDGKVNKHPCLITPHSPLSGKDDTFIYLENLSQEHINAMICETLTASPAYTQELSEQVYQKTRGNIFFVLEFLKSLDKEKLLYFDFEDKKWKWDLEQIRQKPSTDNVVEITSQKIAQLSQKTQELLQTASCIGIQFDLPTLAQIHNFPQEEVIRSIWEAVHAGVLLTLDENYEFTSLTDGKDIHAYFKFHHDKVWQVVYGSIQEDVKQQKHLQIAHIFFQKDWTQDLFDLVNHFNKGRIQITDQEDITQVVKLNLKAAKKARQAQAYEQASEYLLTGLEMLGENCWESEYDLCMTVYKKRVHIEYLRGNFEEANVLTEIVVQNAATDFERAEAYYILIIQYSMLGEIENAIDIAKKALGYLNFKIPANPNTEIGMLYKEVQVQLNSVKDMDELINAKAVSSRKKLLIHILTELILPAHCAQNTGLSNWIVLKTIQLSIKHGIISASAQVFVFYALYQGIHKNDFHLADYFAKLSIKIANEFKQARDKTIVYYLISTYISPWTQSLENLDDDLGKTIKTSMDAELYHTTGYALVSKSQNMFYQSDNIEDLLNDLQEYLKWTSRHRHIVAERVITMMQLMLNNLKKSKIDNSFDTGDLTDSDLFTQTRQMSFIRCQYHILKVKVLYLYEKPQEALENIQQALLYIEVIKGQYSEAILNFYYSLVLLKLYGKVNYQDKKKYLEVIEQNQEQLKQWANKCPANFLHKYLLVSAEIEYRVENKGLDTINLYDKAIKVAKEHKFVMIGALGNELAGKYCIKRNKKSFAKLYIQKSSYLYTLWGSKAKVAGLYKKYPEFFLPSQPHDSVHTISSDIPSTETRESSSSILDYSSVLKFSQALSKEVDLDSLLEKMLQLVIENAGADKGVLVKKEKGRLGVKIRGGSSGIRVLAEAKAIERSNSVPPSIVNDVAENKKELILANASKDNRYASDAYIQRYKPKSILCFPVLLQGELSVIFYLENNLNSNVFTPERLEVLNTLSSQIAISMENAFLYRNLEEKIEELTTSNEELDLFIYRASHDLRGPIARLMGLSQVAKMETKEPSTQGYLDMLEYTAQSMDRILSKLLMINVINQKLGNFEEIDFIEVLEDIKANFTEQIEEAGIDYSVNIDPEVAFKSDLNLVKIILQNVIENAIHYTHSSEKEDVFVHIEVKNRRTFIEIIIHDNGVGIPEEFHEKIFNMFFRGSEKSKGNGLGLYIVKKAVDKLDGRISISSKLDKFTMVSITFR